MTPQEEYEKLRKETLEKKIHTEAHVQQLSDVLLHKETHHTNLSVPFCKHITVETFPEQNGELLGTFVKLKYRNGYIADEKEYSGPDKFDPHDVYEDEFYIVRCDISEPYRMIGISKDYSIILVTDSNDYEKVTRYPVQLDNFIGISVYNQYPGIIPEVKGVTLRVDNGELCYSVIIELLSDNVVRFLIGDECFSKISDYYDPKDLNDYNARNATDYHKKPYNESYVNVDGGDETISPKIYGLMVNGGPADHLGEIYNGYKTREEIAELVKNIMEGKTIYGIN